MENDKNMSNEWQNQGFVCTDFTKQMSLTGN